MNDVLSLGQYNHNMFIHRDMRGRACQRKIANGLVEVCWYLPCGTENIDIFPKPVAFANLRGDIGQSKLFLVVNCKENATEDMMSVKTTVGELDLPKASVKAKDQRVSVAGFSQKICIAIKKSMTNLTPTITIENMLDKAVELGLSVDECKSGEQKKAAEEIMKGTGVRSISGYKSKQLPLQGINWKRLAHLEMEECRLKRAEKRHFFLKWMKLKLYRHSAPEQKEDKALLDSSLGIEHYMREMALIYEVSLQSQDTEMLLDGYPLELLDGDASNVPERWVIDVLMELHRKVGEQSRLLVLTVLGVQSTGNSGRCTRGAYMLFLKVGEDLKSDLNCDFVVLIDTEGLKSPDLAQLEDSYEHDNQLATFVIGLSDVTIINIAMENLTEMKDVLQITAHAFLRMKQIGKKPVCHFVHQNVARVSAHAKTMIERKHLLDQLNEMTQIAAEMERQPSIKAFTDVLDYDIEKNNWNIPGLWHGTPPMAPVNIGYSEAVADFKQNLLDTVKSDRTNEVSKIPEFLEWMKSLWKAVKYENFIFSFRNTLVAHAYDNLCKEFNQWEWDFRKEILSWQNKAELEILNADNEEKLSDYYKKKDRHINLIEKYKVDFINSINSLANEIQHSVHNKLDCVLEQKISSKKVQDIQREYRAVIEDQVMKLLSDCKESTLTDEQLTHEFEKMWNGATVNVSGLKERDIAACVLNQLRKNFSNLNVNKELQNIGDLTDIGKDQFKTTRDHVDSYMKKHYKTNSQFEIELKLHICGIASREFLKMHKKFLSENDPQTQLEKYKTQYLSDFLDLYKQKDDCQHKATAFVQLCIKPAVEEYISRSLGVDIVDEILTSCHSAEYSSRSFFQYNIQKELLKNKDFESFVKYIGNYEIYVKDWIFQHILKKMAEDKTLCKLKNKNLQVIVRKITEAIEEASKREDGALLPDNKESITELISNMRTYLTKDISLSAVQASVPCEAGDTRTKGEWHPYKDYTRYYPDWLIPPDPTIEASDYWKYVLVQYNDRFAQEYKAKPADAPEAWRRITKKQMLKYTHHVKQMFSHVIIIHIFITFH
uniref:VLIG-type G domain-containing protein n=1 Tax=Lates calcarifer TaxID=8187 RepID=A0A4W6FG26_LATCA